MKFNQIFACCIVFLLLSLIVYPGLAGEEEHPAAPSGTHRTDSEASDLIKAIKDGHNEGVDKLSAETISRTDEHGNADCIILSSETLCPESAHGVCGVGALMLLILLYPNEQMLLTPLLLLPAYLMTFPIVEWTEA
ncbi:MAG TPA: hypothetical protein O0Y06_07600 [Methanocorpusculum sp.]|nr:hypothetical protein [Methanocorpusculum sp.]HJK80750.1 hypothetical protein [Methanocorpusculum sp.]